MRSRACVGHHTGLRGLKAHTHCAARQQFGQLQHRTFPWYFNISIVLSGGLLYLWNLGHPHVWANITDPKLADVAQAYALATVVISQLANQAVIGPMTSKYVQRDPMVHDPAAHEHM